MTRLGPARITEANADNDSTIGFHAREFAREVEALKLLHESVKASVGGSDALAFGYCALVVLRRELSEIRRSIDSASRRAFTRA